MKPSFRAQTLVLSSNLSKEARQGQHACEEYARLFKDFWQDQDAGRLQWSDYELF
jgi:hypothetical protein